jgi:hypothetical protein
MESRDEAGPAFLEKKDHEPSGPTLSGLHKVHRTKKPILRKIQSRELEDIEQVCLQNKLSVRPMEESLVVSRLNEDPDEGSSKDLESASHKRHVITLPVPHSRHKESKPADQSQHPDESPSDKRRRQELKPPITLDGLNAKMLASLLGESLQDRLYLKSKLKKIDQTIQTLKMSILQQPQPSANEAKAARLSPAGETKDSITSAYAKRGAKNSKEARDPPNLRSSKSPTGSCRSDFMSDSKPHRLLRNGLLVRGTTKQMGPLSNSFVLHAQMHPKKAASNRNQPFTLRKKRDFIIPADRDRDPPKVWRESAGLKPGSPYLNRPSSFEGRSVSAQQGEPERLRPAAKGWSVRTGSFLHRQSSGSRKESPTKEQFIID